MRISLDWRQEQPPTSAHITPQVHPKTHALRRLVGLIRRRTWGELGQEAAGGSMTRETR